MMKNILLVLIVFLGSGYSKTLYKISSVSIGSIVCGSKAKVRVLAGDFYLADTVLTKPTDISVNKVIPIREVTFNGSLQCGDSTIHLDRVKTSLPFSQKEYSLGYGVVVRVERVRSAPDETPGVEGLEANVAFKRMATEAAKKRLERNGKAR
jgi:hypothetical protein